MEGSGLVSNKLRFVESRRKYRVKQNTSSPASNKLITASNNHGSIIIGCDDKSVKFIAANQVLDFTPSNDKASILNLDNFQFSLQLTFRPTLLTVARYGYSSILLIAGYNDISNCSTIEVIDLDARSSIGKVDLINFSGSEIIDYAWHPNYYDSIVALCTNRGSLLVLAIDRRGQAISIVYSNQQYGVLTCCWSPKGKNLAIGMFNGKILRLEPIITTNSFTFKEVDSSTLTFSNPKITPEHKVIKLRWINKTFLMSVHAKQIQPNGPDTVYSVITVKPSNPYLYWTDICFENQNVSTYIVHLVNLSNSVVCVSNASGEAAVIGLPGAKEASTNDLRDWRSIILDEEGSRIELPLDANNRETHSMGVTVAYMKNSSNPEVNNRPILIFYTNDGVLCPYAAMHQDNILKTPEFQQPAECPIQVPKPVAAVPIPQPTSNLFSLSSMQNSLTTDFSNSLFPAASIPKVSSDLKPAQIFPASAINTTPTSINFAPSRLNVTPSQLMPSQLNLTPTNLSLTPSQLIPTPTQSSTTPSQTYSSPSHSNLSPSQLNISKPQVHNITSVQTTGPTAPTSQVTSISTPQSTNKVAIKPQLDPKKINNLSRDIDALKKGIEFNDTFLSVLDEINQLRTKYDEIQDIHKSHQDVLEVIKENIDALDIGMLENLYLIEYIKSRSKGVSRKRSLDQITLKKVEAIKQKSKLIAEKLKDIDLLVDVSWEDHIRRKNSMVNKDRRMNTLDLIYHNISQNQKTINALKKKASTCTSLDTPSASSFSISNSPKTIEKFSDSTLVRRELNPSKMKVFKEFLASRDVVPVRRPEAVKPKRSTSYQKII